MQHLKCTSGKWQQTIPGDKGKLSIKGKRTGFSHYNDVIMGTIASQITNLTIVYSDADQRKHMYQSSASLAFVRGIHRRPVNSPHKLASNAENASIWWRHHAMQILNQELSLAFRMHCGHFRQVIWLSSGFVISIAYFVERNHGLILHFDEILQDKTECHECS